MTATTSASNLVSKGHRGSQQFIGRTPQWRRIFSFLVLIFSYICPFPSFAFDDWLLFNLRRLQAKSKVWTGAINLLWMMTARSFGSQSAPRKLRWCTNPPQGSLTFNSASLWGQHQTWQSKCTSATLPLAIKLSWFFICQKVKQIFKAPDLLAGMKQQDNIPEAYRCSPESTFPASIYHFGADPAPLDRPCSSQARLSAPQETPNLGTYRWQTLSIK